MKAVKELEAELIRVSEEARLMPDVGSEEYLNACKAQNQIAEAINRFKIKIDPNVILTTAATTVSFVIMLAFNERHIIDTKPISFVKNLFRR